MLSSFVHFTAIGLALCLLRVCLYTLALHLLRKYSIEPKMDSAIEASVKSELESENSRFSEEQSQDTSESGPRLSVVANRDNLKQLIQRTINISAMRTFLAKVKQWSSSLSTDEELEMMLLAISCIDLTTLAGDDTSTNVQRLCYRAVNTMQDDALAQEYRELSCAAVCVYPARVCDCVATFKRLNTPKVNIAAVATGFPSGQYGLKSRLAEIKDAVESGANEIDVVINRAAALSGKWPEVFDELCEMRRACNIRKAEGHLVHLKVIIGAGDLLTSTPSTIYNASLIAILAGADFIKTSTGKESVNATLPIGYIMMRCIVDYYNLTGIRIGFKPAGGIRTYKDALNWLFTVKMLLGPDWLSNKLFRFGASGLLDDLEKRVKVLRERKRFETTGRERIKDAEDARME